MKNFIQVIVSLSLLFALPTSSAEQSVQARVHPKTVAGITGELPNLVTRNSSLVTTSRSEVIGRTLKGVYSPYFKIGAALSARDFVDAESPVGAIAMREFSSVTAENEMKPGYLQPREGEFRWEIADRFVEFGERNGMKIIGHCLVWHNQTPQWFFRKDDGKADRDTLIRRMKDHIYAVVGRYKGRVHGWDVVNEAFDDAGNLHHSPWRDGIGDDFIELAFRFAHEADPKAELYYNDFNMFCRGKREGVVRMVRDFKAKGVRIDAVGLQTHTRLSGPPVAEYEATITALAAAGVKAMITELDVSVLPSAWGHTAEISSNQEYRAKYDPWKDGNLPEEKQRELTRRYCDLFTMFLRHADVIDRVTFWGVCDGRSWLNHFPVRGRTDYPLLFDRAYKPKPCYDTLIELPSTQPMAAMKNEEKAVGNSGSGRLMPPEKQAANGGNEK